MRITFLVIFALSVIIPIGVNDAFAADGSVKSTVEINDSTESGPVLSNQDKFGVSVVNIGDLDGDGVNDMAVGAPYTEVPNSADGTDWCCGGNKPYTNRGTVFILFMNTDGSVKSTVEIDDTTPNGPVLYTNDAFGRSVANIGDLDGDGVNDLAVGADSDNGSYHPSAKNPGAVHIVFMNTDGSVKSTVEIDNTTTNGPNLDINDFFGRSVANIGDLDGDGVNELAVGAPFDRTRDQGAVHILFMNTDGSIKSSVENDSGTSNHCTSNTYDYLGASIAGIGDLDGDGVNDIAAGATHDDNGGTNRGAVRIMFMNTDASVKSCVEINSSTTNGPDLNSSDFFGVSVANIGDLDDDGVNDLAVGAKGDNAEPAGANRGAVHIMFMNTDASVKSTVEINTATPNGPALANTDIFGYGVTEIGDLDGNCVNDLAVGAPQDDNGGANRGAVHILFMKADAKAKADCELPILSDCYDCEAPKLTKVEVHITSPNSDTQRISTSSEIWYFDQDTPLPMFGDSITPIVADPGDEVEIILELTDNRTLKTITDSGTYTNFLNKPDDMNLFYANNFDEYGKVSTTFSGPRLSHALALIVTISPTVASIVGFSL